MLFECEDHIQVFKSIDLDSALKVNSVLRDSSFMVTAAYMAPELLQEGEILKAKKCMYMWSLGILIFRVFHSEEGSTFWTCLDIDNDDESIKSAIALGKLNQQSIDSVIDREFFHSNVRHILKRLLKIDPVARDTIHCVEHSSLVRGGVSFPVSKLFVKVVESVIDPK